MFCAMCHTHAFQCFGDKRFAFTRAHPAVGERQLHILKYCEIADQIETLEDETDFAIANPCTIRKGKIGDFVFFQGIAALRRSIDSSVVLPQPDGPAIETYSPTRMSR